MDENEIRISFLRQRRNLIGVSLVLLFITYSGISLNKLNILGNEFDIANPRIIDTSLWIAFLYWLLRYFQYLHFVGNRGIEDAYARKLFIWAMPSADAQFRSAVEAQCQAEQSTINRLVIESRSWFPDKPSILNPLASLNFRIQGQLARTFPRRDEPTSGIPTIDLKVNLKRRDLLVLWLRGVTYVSARTPLFTEYVLPPLLAFFVLTMSVFHRWF